MPASRRTQAPSAPAARRPVPRRVIGIVVLGLAATAIVVSDAFHAMAINLIDGFGALIGDRPIAGAVVYVGLTGVSAMFSFFSTAVLVPAAVQVWGEFTTILLQWSGSIIGGVGAYGLGRRLGRPAARFFVGEARVAYYGDRLNAEAGFGLILLLQLALQSEIPGYLLGTLRYRPRLFLAALALGTLPYAVAMVYGGRLFMDRRPLLMIALAGLLLAGTAWAFMRLQRSLRAGAPRTDRGND